MKKLFGTLVAVGAMALMAVGVQAATYSASADVTPVDGVASVDVMVSPDDEAVPENVNGYVVYLTYDGTKLDPQITDDVTYGDCYATVADKFNNTTVNNSVFVSDVVSGEDTANEVLAVAWAGASAVSVDAADTVLANVKFAPTEAFTTGSEEIGVEVVALTSDGTSVASDEELATINSTVSAGSVVINASDFELGDVNHSGAVNSRDAALIAMYEANIQMPEGEIFDILLADVNNSGAVTSRDAALIAMLEANNIEVFPDESM